MVARATRHRNSLARHAWPRALRMRPHLATQVSWTCHTKCVIRKEATDILLELVGDLLECLVERIVGFSLGLRVISDLILSIALPKGEGRGILKAVKCRGSWEMTGRAEPSVADGCRAREGKTPETHFPGLDVGEQLLKVWVCHRRSIWDIFEVVEQVLHSTHVSPCRRNLERAPWLTFILPGRRTWPKVGK